MRYALILLFLVSTAFAEDEVRKFPVPDELDLVESYAIIDEVFGNQIKVAKDAEAKAELAISFLTTAATAADRFEKYALIEQAQRLALEASDLQLYFCTIDAMGETFQIDKVKQWGDQLVKLLDGQADEATLRQLAETDFAASNDPTKRSVAADTWYDLSKNLKSTPDQIAKDRAALHYRAAMPGLKGLIKLRSQKRLQECQKSTPTTRTTRTITSRTASKSKAKVARYGHGRIIKVDCTKGLSLREAQKTQRSAAKAYGVPVGITNQIGMRFRFIPAGTFIMGSPENEAHRQPDEKQHVVKFSKPFYMGMTEVTQGQYGKVIGQKPSQHQNQPNNPVEKVNQHEAIEFCKKLSQLDSERTYQLPTMARFEYTSRAGILGSTYGPINKISWNAQNSKRKTQPVSLLAPNAWGLYDTFGNVWEWCLTEEGQPYSNNKNIKGLSMHFESSNKRYRFAYNGGTNPSNHLYDLGFRVYILLNAK